MAENSTDTVQNRAGITTSGNREEREAQVGRIQERHERLHRPDDDLTVKASATTKDVAELSEAPMADGESD